MDILVVSTVVSYQTKDSQNISKSSCELLQFDNSTRSAQSVDPISDHLELLIYRIKSSVCIPILFLVGFPANCINMVIFAKQGLRERINLCLFSLSLVDLLLNLLFFIFHSDMLYTDFASSERFGIAYRYLIDTNIVGFYGLVHGSMVLSTIICCERCFCVVFPLQSKRFLKTKTMGFLIIFCVSLVTFSRFVSTAKYRMACVFDSQKNSISYRLGLSGFHLISKTIDDIIDSSIFGLGLGVGCPVVSLIATIITALKLKEIISWKKFATSSISMKEVAVTKMLVCLSIQFLVLSIPVVCLRLSPLFISDLNGAGQFKNSFQVILHITEVSANTNSSLNFFVYYFAGTKYRQTLKSVFRCNEIKKREVTSNCYSLGPGVLYCETNKKNTDKI